MPKIKTADLTGPTLDWAVAKAEGYIEDFNSWLFEATVEDVRDSGNYHPSTDWAVGGPIIERGKIDLEHTNWTPPLSFAKRLGDEDGSTRHDGPTALIAAMRCYVASKLGDEIDVPDELN